MRSGAHRSQAWGALFLAVWILLGASQVLAGDSRYDEPRHERYVFATTRGVNEMDVHPALKVTILPLAVLLDVLFLPFASLADAMS
jgi:hypothetical protein